MPILSSAVRGLARMPILLGALLLCALVPGAARAQDHAHHGHAPAAEKSRHPEPRAGITGERVLPADSVSERGREVYTMAARIPGLLDGIYCHCDCHERDGLRSLLECFENAMASTCGICLGQARLAHEMNEKGKSLNEIRQAVDEGYGP